HAALRARRQTLLAGDVHTGAAVNSIRLTGILHDRGHPTHNSPCVPERMLLNNCQRLARTRAVALDSVRIIQTEICSRGNFGSQAFLLHDVAIVRRRAEFFRAALSFANSFQEICSRAEARRYKGVKGNRVAEDYQRDKQKTAEDNTTRHEQS